MYSGDQWEKMERDEKAKTLTGAMESKWMIWVDGCKCYDFRDFSYMDCFNDIGELTNPNTPMGISAQQCIDKANEAETYEAATEVVDEFYRELSANREWQKELYERESYYILDMEEE